MMNSMHVWTSQLVALFSMMLSTLDGWATFIMLKEGKVVALDVQIVGSQGRDQLRGSQFDFLTYIVSLNKGLCLEKHCS